MKEEKVARVAGGFFWLRFAFLVRICTAARGLTRKRWRRGEEEEREKPLKISLPSPLDPYPTVFWYDLGSRFRATVSHTYQLQKKKQKQKQKNASQAGRGVASFWTSCIRRPGQLSFLQILKIARMTSMH